MIARIRTRWALSLLAALPAQPFPCALEDLAPRISLSAKRLAHVLSGAVAWEDYEQLVLDVEDRSAPVAMKLVDSSVVARRTLGSDVLLLRLPSGSFYGFRDVARVDGREVAERGERIRKLFLERGDPNETRALIEESARYNIGDVQRDLNLPTLILALLVSDTPAGKDRVEYSVVSDGARGDGTCAVSFREAHGPYLVGTPEGRELPLRGTLSVVPTTGWLRRVTIQAGRPASEHIELVIDFAAFDGWEEWLPMRMTEVYAPRMSPRLTRCEARYSNYRRFSVDTSEKWKIPK